MHRDPYLRGINAAIVMATGLFACLSGENVDLGRNVDSGAPGLGGIGADATLPDDAGGPLLSAAISASAGMICEGDCVDLFATASGGSGSYDYAWGQGLGEGPGPKSVCPAATTTYSVVVTSSASEQQSTASAMVTVVRCDSGTAPPRSDAGPTSTPSDSGSSPPATASLCVPNSSFEGPTMVGSSPPGIPPTAAPPQWQVCLGDPDVDPSVSLQPPSDGMSYVGLAAGSGTFYNTTEAIGTALCASLQPGTHYSFCVDLGTGVRGVTPLMVAPNTPPPVLEMWGGGSPCNQDELLWTSPPITNTDSWVKVCGTFVPSRVHPYLLIIPAQGGAPLGAGAWSYVIVDHLVPGP